MAALTSDRPKAEIPDTPEKTGIFLVRISVQADHAIQVLIELAVRRPANRISTTQQLAEALTVSSDYLAKTLARLHRAGLVRSHAGAGGGFSFKRDPFEITVAHVLEAIDGPLMLIGDYPPDELFSGETPTPLTQLWISAHDSLRVILDEITIAQLASGTLAPRLDTLARLPIPERSGPTDGGRDVWDQDLATCPLRPAENRLPVPIEAGEKIPYERSET
jgi:Rrf2 family protein